MACEPDRWEPRRRLVTARRSIKPANCGRSARYKKEEVSHG